MNGFWSSTYFRSAWVTSVIAGLLFPFLSALMPSEAEASMSYLMRVNDGFLKTALTFSAVFLIIQLLFARYQYLRAKSRRDPKGDTQ
ncbi:hypothetical protein [Celeribacter sp.]|uniref:hypothetical protein n=1 Tax=Celeribacter sp. TaxID=1890673 RepID=UPI003A94E342